MTMPIDAPCLVCGRRGPSHSAHWPVAKGMGGRRVDDLPRVPMCVECHIGGEHTEASPLVTETLIRKAPDYWRARGEWEASRPHYDRFVARREHEGAK